MKKKGLLFILFIMFSFALTGCWDNHEMEDRSYVITLGVDKYSGEESSRYTLSLGSAQLSALSKNDDNKEAIPTVFADGKTLSSAVKKADCQSSREMYLGQLKTVVFGKELLEDKTLLTSVLDELERNQDISEKIILLGTDGEAADCVAAILQEDSSTGMFLWDFYKNTSDNVAVTRRLNLESFLMELRNSEGCSVLPKISMKDKKIRLGGGIALADYQLCGVLNDDEERGSLYIKGEAKGDVVEGKWENTVVPVWVYRNKVKTTFSEQDGRLVCHILSKSQGSVEGSDFLEGHLLDSHTIKVLEKEFEEFIKRRMEDTIKLSQQQYGEDVFDFASDLRRKNYGLYNKYGENRQNMIKNMIFDVQADLQIRTTGVIQ